MAFSAMEARFRRIFIGMIAILPGFPDFPEKTFKFFDVKTYFKSKISGIRSKSFKLKYPRPKSPELRSPRPKSPLS